MGIFLLQFMMKFADRLVGKGLDTWLLIKLVVFNLSWMLVLVIPMATLVATLMAYGNFSQNNEITILKSSGVSLVQNDERTIHCKYRFSISTFSF